MISDLVDSLIEGRPRDLGGFEVERILPAPRRKMVGPFIFLDHMGPALFPPGGGIDVRPHPHIGLSTVTYLFEGEIVHRDSLGFTETIRPGEVNWMTAGAGITHSERTDPARRARGAASHGMQAWVALPDALETCAPSFSHHGPEDLPTYEGGGLWARLIAGEAFGAKAKTPVMSPLFYVHWRLQPGAEAQLDATYPERAAFIVTGSLEVDGRTYTAGRLLILAKGHPVVFTAVEAAEVMLLGGESVGERYIWWNFVSSSKARIEAAKADWSAGRMALPPEDFADVIPLPDDPPPAAQPM
jgi:redox-sensitive bicupin YhaK (pirin superfamily)